MSHNRIKIGNAEPNLSGVVSPSLSDFGVASITEGEVLGYVTADGWSGVNPPSAARIVFSAWQRTASFSTSTANYDANDNVIWRNAQLTIDNSTYATRNASSGTRVPSASTSWTMSWTLLASELQGKKIRCEAVHMAKDLSGTEEITYQWGVGSSDLATYTPIGNVAHQNQYYTQTAYGHYEVGVSDINLALKVVSVSGAIGILTSAQALNSYLTIGIIEE